jgi:hypothetical protein
MGELQQLVGWIGNMYTRIGQHRLAGVRKVVGYNDLTA